MRLFSSLSFWLQRSQRDSPGQKTSYSSQSDTIEVNMQIVIRSSRFLFIYFHRKNLLPSNLGREIWSLSSESSADAQWFSSNPPRISVVKSRDILTKKTRVEIKRQKREAMRVEINMSRIFAFNIIGRIESIKLKIACNFQRSEFFFRAILRNAKGFFRFAFQMPCVRTWLLPQNFKAHKATKSEEKGRKKFVWFCCNSRWCVEAATSGYWVTILMRVSWYLMKGERSDPVEPEKFHVPKKLQRLDRKISIKNSKRQSKYWVFVFHKTAATFSSSPFLSITWCLY